LVLTTGDIPALYGEDQARYLVACGPSQAGKLLARAAEAGVPAARVGRFGGAVVRFGVEEAPLKALSASYRSAFARAVA
jgi:phosphoribosylformylglycinamidine synthase